MTRTLAVAAVSPRIQIGDVVANMDRLRDALAEQASGGARLIVAPELTTSGYVFADRAEARDAALTRDDPRWRLLCEVLPESVVAVVGYCEKDDDRVYNTAAVLGRDGRLGDYRKSHLWGAEKTIFDLGDTGGAVIDTPVGRLGVAICYDNEFPEIPRRIALAGAEILALPVNWPAVDRPPGEHPPEIIQAMAAARTSRLATVIADRHGDERGVVWTGGTAVIDEDGWIAATAVDGAAGAELTLRDLGDKSLPPFNDLFADRRPELY